MRVNVIFIITGLAYGGAETQLVNLAIKLKERGWDVQVVSMLPPQAYINELKSSNIPVESLNINRDKPDPRGIFRLAKIIWRERPQIVHSHMIHANLLARFIRLFTPIPILICTAHSTQESGKRGSLRIREIMYRVTDSLCDITTQVSRFGLERYIQVGAVPRHKIIFIPNGIDTNRFYPSYETGRNLRHNLGLNDEFVWLAVGRFEEAKDYPTMVQAFRLILQEYENTILLIAGQGSLKKEIEQYAKQLHIREKIIFLGVRKDIPELMNVADAYVMSSAWEGLPMVLLEAAATGLPIVATNVGGNGEVVLDGESGFLVPPQNSKALAESMLKLMSLEPDERRKMGERGRKHIEENYSLDRVIEQWEILYKKLLTKRGFYL